MKKSFIISILLLLFVVGCSCPSAVPPLKPESKPSPPVDPEHAIQLARIFSPIIYLKGEGEAENFDPEPIEVMVDEAVLRDVEDPSFFQKATLLNLLQWSKSIYYLDLEGLGPESHSFEEYKLAYDRIKNRYQPTIYARVREGGDKNYTVVQYWIFYYFNDWRNFHEGDWELVQLCFPGRPVKELLERKEPPIFAAYSQHQAGQKMSWADMRSKGLVINTHPIVHVAQGSHANYFTPGNSWSGLDFDDTGLSSWNVIGPEQFDIVLLPEVESESERSEWLGFKGYWGEYLGISISVLGLTFWQQGPHGPPWSGGEQTSEKWAQPGEWADGLPEYPEPFWMSFFSLPGDWFKQAFFCLFSPANIHVYDSRGRHVGINEKGEIEIEIPGAMYINPEGTQYKTIIVPNADVSQEYELVVEGTGSGNMDIKVQVPDAKNRVKRYLEYINVPVSATTTARVRIMPDVPLPEITTEGFSVRDDITILELDRDGDGKFELESAPGIFERREVLPSKLKARIDIEPDTLSLGTVTAEEFITTFIELPPRYSPKSIDIGTVRLIKDISPLKGLIDIVDHDQNGVPELMVRFDRQLVIEHLKRRGLAEGNVPLTLTGIVNGRPFEGETIVLVASKTIKQTPGD
ncbi:hypothetical protein ACFLX4_02400 [Chloroflexota bacterium]